MFVPNHTEATFSQNCQGIVLLFWSETLVCLIVNLPCRKRKVRRNTIRRDTWEFRFLTTWQLCWPNQQILTEPATFICKFRVFGVWLRWPKKTFKQGILQEILRCPSKYFLFLVEEPRSTGTLCAPFSLFGLVNWTWMASFSFPILAKTIRPQFVHVFILSFRLPICVDSQPQLDNSF